MQDNQYLQIRHQNEGSEKSNLSPSSKDTPTEEGELTPERDEVSKLMQNNQHLYIMCQNGCKERSNLSPSSKDDTMNTKDDGRNCKIETGILRPEPWRKKLGGDKKEDYNLGTLTIVKLYNPKR